MLCSVRIRRPTDLILSDLAQRLNPIVGGWMSFYGRFRYSVMQPVLLRVDAYLRKLGGEEVPKVRTYNASRAW